MVYFYYVNKGTKKLRENVTMTTLENLKICPPFTEDKNFSVNVSPNNELTVLYKYDPLGENYVFNCSIKAGLDNVPGYNE
jgi:hypothetical protein